MDRARPQRDRRLLAILFATSLLASLALGFRPRVHALERGVDPSYMFSASYASENGWRWGRDFISTFGPYGYLIHAVDIGAIPAKRLGAELILSVLAAAACAGYLATRGPARLGAALPLVILLTYAVHVQGNSQYGDEYRWLTVLLLLVLITIHAPRRFGLATLAVAGAMAGFFLLVKLSLGLGGLLSLLAACLLAGRPLQVLRSVVIVACGAPLGLAAGWLAHEGTLAGIPGFVSTAVPVISGYSSAMSLAPEGWERTAICIAAFALALAVWGLRSESARGARTLLACVTPLFIAWKHAMVRQDAVHVEGFVLAGLFVVCALLVEAARQPRSRALILAASLPPLLAAWLLSGESGSLPRRLAAPFRFDGDRTASFSLARLHLSPAARARIGDLPVDVYPWESVYVAANDLHWRNRPSPASFATFEPTLDSMNARFFSADDRPPFLLWNLESSVHSIDERHLFWDEPQTLLAILSTYRLVARDTAFLLEASPRPVLSPPRALHVTEAKWGTWIPVPDAEGGAVLASVILERPWWAAVRRVVFREDPVLLTARFDSGEEQTYRLVPDQAASGLWVSPLPRHLAELQRILEGDLSWPHVRAIRLDGGWGSPDLAPVVVSWLRVQPTAPAYGRQLQPLQGDGLR